MLLSDLLKLEILRSAGLRVVTAGAVDRPVRWVHTGEIADIARYLSGGELLLTAGIGLGDSEAERRRYVRELAAAGAVGVILELGRSFRRIPAEMVEEATALGLLLAELEREVPFVEVTQQVHTALLSEQHEAQERATDIGDRFAQLVLDGESVPAMLEFLAQRLHNPVVLEDGSRHVIASGSYRQPLAPVLRSWQLHSREGHQGGEVGVHRAESEPPCAWSSIALRGEVWGRLHVLEVDTPLDQVSHLALGRVASNMALHLLAERDAYLSETAERALVGEVARGINSSSEDFLARASGLGAHLGTELVMVVVGPAPAGRGERRLPAGEKRVRDALRSARWPGLVGLIDGRVAVVATAAPPDGLAGALDAFSANLRVDRPDLHIGVSRPARPSMLDRATREAQTAQALGPSAQEGLLHCYDDLVLHRLLAPLLQTGPELATFVESELGELLRHDDEHHSELVRTLDAYLQTNGSKAGTADTLFLQRRSVYYRLSRIEELLGRSLDSPDARVRLYLALRARELLEARSEGL